jgi:phage terminase large subunit
MIQFLPKQLDALKYLVKDSPCELVLFGGAAGGSKSFLGCAWQIQRRLKYDGSRGLIGRSKLDTLKKTTLKTFFECASLYGLRANVEYTFNAQSNIITFANKSEIILKDLFQYPSDSSFDSLGSLEITDFFVDECSQVSKKAIDILRSRVRFKLVEYNLIPKGILTCNPSKNWLYNEFYAPYKNGCLPSTYAFVQATARDNPHLPPSYLETLARLPEIDRKRLLEGDWDYDETIDYLFHRDDLLRCFRDEPASGDMYITCDVARLGKDRTMIGLWKGLQLLDLFEFRKNRINDIVDTIRQMMISHSVRLSNIIADEDGVGGGVVDMLKCRGFLNGSKAKKSDKYMNNKSECYFKLAEMIEQNKIVLPMKFRDNIIKELDMIRRKNPDADTRLSVTSKDEIQRLYGISPDMADCIMMRMYFELNPNYGKYSYI